MSFNVQKASLGWICNVYRTEHLPQQQLCTSVNVNDRRCQDHPLTSSMPWPWLINLCCIQIRRIRMYSQRTIILEVFYHYHLQNITGWNGAKLAHISNGHLQQNRWSATCVVDFQLYAYHIGMHMAPKFESEKSHIVGDISKHRYRSITWNVTVTRCDRQSIR